MDFFPSGNACRSCSLQEANVAPVPDEEGIHRVLCAPSQREVLGGVEALVAPSATATPGEGLAGEELAESVAHQAGPVDQHPKPNLESAGEVLEAGYSSPSC